MDKSDSMHKALIGELSHPNKVIKDVPLVQCFDTTKLLATGPIVRNWDDDIYMLVEGLEFGISGQVIERNEKGEITKFNLTDVSIISTTVPYGKKGEKK